VDWTECKTAFSCDASLRDVYVFDTTIEDWNKMLQLLKRQSYSLSFTSDGEPAFLPSDAADVFNGRSEHTQVLSIDLGGLVLNCHFFGVQEIELDIDPQEVSDQRFQLLSQFLQNLSNELEKPIILTPENAPTVELFRVMPTTLPD
jgi:hypothetical protein